MTQHEEAVRLARAHGRVAGKQDFPSAGFTIEGLAALIADVRRQDVPDADWLSNVIRTADGDNTMGAGALAEVIVEAIRARLEEGKV